MTERSVYDRAGHSPRDETVSVIWIIDSEQWPRAMLRAELIERGFDAVGYIRVADTSPSRFPDAIVVELRGVSRDEIAQLFQLGVPVIAVAGKPEPDWLNEFKWATVLRRPVSIGEIGDAVTRRI
jgi:hypothetical protein